MAPLTRARCRGAQLKLLACHISGGEQSGTVYANGQPIVEAEFKNQLAVVWQSDVLLPTATVRRGGARAGFRAWGARLHAGAVLSCCWKAGDPCASRQFACPAAPARLHAGPRWLKGVRAM